MMKNYPTIRNEKNQGSITALAYVLLRVWVAEEVEEVEVSAAHVPFRLHRLQWWLLLHAPADNAVSPGYGLDSGKRLTRSGI